jgi:hypothetical protein
MPSRHSRNQTRRTTPSPALSNAVTPVVVYALWTQEEAAHYLSVSPRFLRDSACPKITLPGNGKRGESLVRYKPEDVIRWVDAWRTRPHLSPPDKDAA